MVFSAGSSHFQYLIDYERWSRETILRRYARARRVYAPLGVIDPLLNPRSVTLSYTVSESARRVYRDFGVPEDRIRVLRPGIDEPTPRLPRPGPA